MRRLNLELAAKLQAAEEKNQRALSMAQQTKTGHVYVISNVGSFGEDVFKVGLTRRLEPLDRIRELGDLRLEVKRTSATPSEPPLTGECVLSPTRCFRHMMCCSGQARFRESLCAPVDGLARGFL